HYDLSPRDVQQDVARRQLLLAERLDLPVIIHLREATEDLLKLLRETRRNYRGIIHCYTGSVETARILLDLGFHIAFGGAVTFKNANKILDAARYVPDDRLLIETDSPYMTPVPFRGKRNEPKYVALVADKLAELRGCSSEQIAELTMRNAFTLFGL
ncbi:MAG: TatD family hydrolase, partial [Eubacteriales bacterium]|nr:TatD family hydrolase [Eubacteriales bacterium]